MNTSIAKIVAASTLGLLLAAPVGAAQGMMLSVSAKGPGKHLVDGKGMSLYVFEADHNGMSACSGKCAKAWPPLTASQKPEAMGGVDASMLGTTKRKDGSMQVTYDGMPLYYFVRDKAPGDMNGQGVNGFGGEWYLVGPGGHALEGSMEMNKNKTRSTY